MYSYFFYISTAFASWEKGSKSIRICNKKTGKTDAVLDSGQNKEITRLLVSGEIDNICFA